MATRKMTFTLPDDLADQFVEKVAARKRSHYLAQALAQKLRERDRQLVHACEVANRDPEVQAIEKEFDVTSSQKGGSGGAPITSSTRRETAPGS